jgi:hypothetical protein
MEKARRRGTKNRINFGKKGELSGMNLDSMTMRMEAARPGGVPKGRRWRSISEKEPFSGTSSSTAVSPEPLTWWDVIEHPEDHMKREK